MSRLWILLFAQILISSLGAQPGRLDVTFNTFDNGQRGEGFNGDVRCAYGLSDGRILTGGSFSGFSGSQVNHLTMLRTDGQRDTGFALTGVGFNNSVNVVVPYTGGTWLVGGEFGSYNNITRRGIALLNSNGTLNAGFVPTPTLGVNNIIKAIAVQPDGKILIGGDLVRTGGATRLGIIRLESNGSLDAGFGSGGGVPIGRDVNSIFLQSDGKIIIGGDFNTYDGITVGRICRLNEDGSLDASFNGGGNRFSTVGVVHALIRQPDGTVLVGGTFDAYNGLESRGLVKLLSNGNVDNSFTSPYNGGPSVACYSLALHQDSTHIYVGGLLGLAGTGRHVALLNQSGTIEPSFIAPLLLSPVTTTVPLSNGQIFISNGLSAATIYTPNQFNPRKYANRLFSDGRVDSTFMQSAGLQSFSTGIGGVTAMAVLPDDKVIIGGGDMRYFNDIGRWNLARLEPNGELDLSFNADSASSGTIEDIAVDPATGKVVVVGTFSRFQGQNRQSIVRLLPSGQVDNSFLASGTALSGTTIKVVRHLSVGRWLVAGQFKQFNGVTAYYLARLSADGVLDNDFTNQVNTYFSSDGVGLLYDIKVLPDGRFLVGGSIGSLSGTGGVARPWVKLFNANGTIDQSFNVSFSNHQGHVFAVEWLGDGRVAIAGSFRFMQAPNNVRVAAVLLPDGTIDPLWAGTTRLSGTINRLLANVNGGLLLGGRVINYNAGSQNYTRKGLMMLTASGGFNPADFTAQPISETNAGIGPYYIFNADPGIEELAFTHDGKLLIGGYFTRYGGILKHGIARILLGPPDPEGLLKICPGSPLSISASSSGTLYQWQAKPETGEWANIADNAVYSGTQAAVLQFTNTPSNLYGYQFRCLIDGVPSPIVATLRFEVVWSGAVNNDWGNTANWNCGVLPDSQTDVILRYGAQVVLPSNVSIRSLRLQNGTSISVANNVEVQINK